MFAVIEFVDNASVAVVPTSWLVGSGEAYWPLNPTSKTYISVEHEEPRPEQSTRHKIRLHKLIADYDEAIRAQDYLLDNSSLLSSEATFAMDNFGKRKRKPVVFSDSTMDDNCMKKRRRVVVDLSPSPPHLINESIMRSPIKRPLIEHLPSTSHTLGNLKSSTPMHAACSYVDIDSDEHKENRYPVGTKNTYGEWVKASINRLSVEMQQMRRATDEILKIVSNKNVDNIISCQIPVRNNLEFDQLDEKLENEKFYSGMMRHLSNTGAHTVGQCTRKIIGLLIADDYLWKLNWRGVHGRRALSKTRVCKIVMDAVQQHELPGADMRIVAEKIQRYIQRSRKIPGDQTEEPVKDAGVQTDSL